MDAKTKDLIAKEIEDFETHLIPRQLSERTLQAYKFHLPKILLWVGKYKLTQESIDKLIAKHNYSDFIATLKNWLNFRKVKDVEVQKKTGRKEQKIHETITLDKFHNLLHYIHEKYGVKYAIMLLISYYGGLRRKEVLNIKENDFYFDEWQTKMDKGCKLKISLLGAKGKKERIVVIPSNFAEDIYTYCQNNRHIIAERNGFVIGVGKTMWDKVFRTACFGCGFYDEVDGKKVSHFTLHDLRRSIATTWFDKGKDIFNVSKRLGHADISTTQRYINPDMDKMLSDWEEE